MCNPSRHEQHWRRGAPVFLRRGKNRGGDSSALSAACWSGFCFFSGGGADADEARSQMPTEDDGADRARQGWGALPRRVAAAVVVELEEEEEEEQGEMWASQLRRCAAVTGSPARRV